jgi:beta-N-acetylhexosaminidase
VTQRGVLERLAAAVLCVGFDGARAADAPLDRLHELAPGGIILFDRNTGDLAQTRALVDDVSSAIEDASGNRPFVAIDQEGGRVARLRTGAHEIPSMMALGAAGDPALAARIGALVAADLRSAGVTIDFAPVLDLADAPASAVVGTRSFGDDPARVAALGIAFARGLESGGIAAVFKHFPGHGATAEDTHERMPAIELAAELVRERHVAPFAAAIAAGARAIMLGHLDVRAFDPGTPATVSPRIVGDLLRGALGFTGACFTDCLQMKAIADTIGTARAAVRAIAAGVDCALISHSLDVARAARDAIVDAVERGELTREGLAEAAGRLAALRLQPALPAVDEFAARDAARRAVTIVRAPATGILPLKKNEPVTVISFEGVARTGVEGVMGRPSLSLALRRRAVRSELLRVELEPDAEMVENLVSLLAMQPGRRVLLLARAAIRHAGQRRALQALLRVAPAATVVALAEPFDAQVVAAAQRVLCTYGDGELAIDALADVLTGRAQATGTLPVSLGVA